MKKLLDGSVNYNLRSYMIDARVCSRGSRILISLGEDFRMYLNVFKTYFVSIVSYHFISLCILKF